MAENYDLIFGQSASSQYAWSDSDYQNGWQTVGSTPPTAEQFDALQRRSDTKAKDLNDRLTPIEANNTSIFRQPSTAYSVGDVVYVKGAGVKYYLLCVTAGTTAETDIDMTGVADGSSITDGAVTWTIRKLTTVASSTVAGIMKLYSSKGTNTDGTMTQQAITNELGNLGSLIGSGGGIVAASLSSNGYVKFANGLIIQWGRYITNTAATTVTYYPIAFPNACLALAVTPGSSASEDVTVTISSNQTIPNDYFTWAAWKANAYDTIAGNVSISYIAIGY